MFDETTLIQTIAGDEQDGAYWYVPYPFFANWSSRWDDEWKGEWSWDVEWDCDHPQEVLRWSRACLNEILKKPPLNVTFKSFAEPLLRFFDEVGSAEGS